MGRSIPIIRLLALFIVLMSLTACGVGPVKRLPETDRNDSILTLDYKARHSVAVQHLSISRTPTDRMQVDMEIVNTRTTVNPATVQIRTVFLNNSGTVIGEDTPYELYLIPPRGAMHYVAKSASPDAVDYRIEIRTPPKE